MLQPSIEKYLRNKACSLVGYQRWSEYNEDCIALVTLFLLIPEIKKNKVDFDICDQILDQESGFTRYLRQRLKSRSQKWAHAANSNVLWIINKWEPARTTAKTRKMYTRRRMDRITATTLKHRVASEIVKGYKEWAKVYNGTW